jgi:hypothetical protein
MDEFLINELKENYESANVILTLLFAVIDFIIIIFSLFNLGSKNKKIFLLKYKLISLFIIDIILKILYTNKDFKINSLYKEIFFQALISIQFHLILSFLEQGYNDTRISNKEYTRKKWNSKFLCIIFSFVTFPYDKFSSSEKEICFIQSLILIYGAFVLYSKLKNKIIKIVQNILKQTTPQDKNMFLCILGSPLPCLMFFVTYYILRIIFLSINNQDSIIYANIILKIIKDSSKYFLFFILEVLLYILSENKVEKEYLAQDSDENKKIKNNNK